MPEQQPTRAQVTASQVTVSQVTVSQVTVYGADWCGDCRRSKRTLERLAVPYTWVDVAADEEALEEAVVISGRHNIPVITFADGSHLVEPADRDLLEALIRVGALTV